MLRVGTLIKALKAYPKDRNIVIGLPEIKYTGLAYKLEETIVTFEDGVKRKVLLVSGVRPAIATRKEESKDGPTAESTTNNPSEPDPSSPA